MRVKSGQSEGLVSFGFSAGPRKGASGLLGVVVKLSSRAQGSQESLPETLGLAV